MQIRNIAIIAHVDHGKTTLTDALLRQTGMCKDETQSMDSHTLEKERGITIYAKNTSLFYKGTKINIVDTPGHADFGSEVERVLRSIDSVLLVVDAQEGPMPQTKFVLKKSLELGLKPIVVINKIDKIAADPEGTHEKVLELFMDLGANDEQLDFQTIYANGKKGIAKKESSDESKNLNPLLDLILQAVPQAPANIKVPFRFQPFNLAYDDYLGRLAIGRMHEGVAKIGQQVTVKKPNGASRRGTLTKIYTFEGFERKEVEQAQAGDIVMLAGIPDVYIGETIMASESGKALPAILVDEPTLSLKIFANDSPFAGQEGKFVTSRQIRERLEKELEVNVGLKVKFFDDAFEVFGRGEMQIAILLENMRRDGYEMQVSQPQVIIKEQKGLKLEPFEEVIIDVPNQMSGRIIEKLAKRKGKMLKIENQNNITRMVLEIPTRGLLGYRSQFMIDTKGEGILTSNVVGFKPYIGKIIRRSVGSMISMATGKALGYALSNLQQRGELYIEPTTQVYEGMVIGNASKGLDIAVNPIKGKHLTNMRSAGADEAYDLTPPNKVTLERGLEIMAEDEYLEITPKSVRLRKKELSEIGRKRVKRK